MFDIAIQSPFTAQPVRYSNCNKDKALVLYQEIDWVDLYKQMETSGDSAESPFYYYEISRNNSIGEKETLCISGYIREAVCVGYFRPKAELRGFFKKKEVINPEFQTQMDGMDIPFANTCLQAFLRGDSNYLEQNMYDREAD